MVSRKAVRQAGRRRAARGAGSVPGARAGGADAEGRDRRRRPRTRATSCGWASRSAASRSSARAATAPSALAGGRRGPARHRPARPPHARHRRHRAAAAAARGAPAGQVRRGLGDRRDPDDRGGDRGRRDRLHRQGRLAPQRQHPPAQGRPRRRRSRWCGRTRSRLPRVSTRRSRPQSLGRAARSTTISGSAGALRAGRRRLPGVGLGRHAVLRDVVPDSGSSSTRQVRQKSSPNGVRWMLRRTTLVNRAECIASSTSGCASSTWYSIGSRSGSRENQTSPSRYRLLR